MPTFSQGLKIVDVLGVFYREADGTLMVADEFEGTRDVETILRKFVGEHVRILAHHLPTQPHDSSRWGGGSCLFEAAGHCPFGHHEDPRQLFTLSVSGQLSEDGGWCAKMGDDVAGLHLNLLVGHRSQLVLVRPADVAAIDERIRNVHEGDPKDLTMDELLTKLTDARDLLADINRLKDEIDA